MYVNIVYFFVICVISDASVLRSEPEVIEFASSRCYEDSEYAN